MQMTGSAINTDIRGIVAGMPLAEVAGGVKIADSSSTAFALATDGAPPGGVVGYTTDEIVQRKNWGLIAGTDFLTSGSTYFVGTMGRLATAGNQSIGTAISGTQLRVRIGAATTPAQSAPPAVQPIISGVGKPTFDTGVIGQYYVDTKNKIWYGPKNANGWVPFLTS